MKLLNTSVQSLSRVRLFATPLTTVRQASLSITKFRSSPKPMSIESLMPSNYLILCHPLLLLPSIFSSIRVFSNELALCKTLKGLLQHHSLKASILQRSAFFMVQLSHLYMTAGKSIAFTIWTFVGKVMSLLFSTLSRFLYLFFQGASIF